MSRILNVSAEELASIVAEMDAARASRAELMPDQQAAIRVLFEAFDRLRELGWREGIYCPKDGTYFDTIEAGSTGIHECAYVGKWPDGYFMTVDDRDAYPSSFAPTLFRLKPADDAARKERMAAAAQRFKDDRDNSHD
ncbi:MAG: hypothetical protein ACKVQR_04330 [Aquabacterium sp.]